MTHATIERSSGPGVFLNGGTLSVAASTFAHNDTGIALGNSASAPTLDLVVFNFNNVGLLVTGNFTPVLTLCSFVGNMSFGVNNTTSSRVNAISSWWGSTTGPTHVTNAGGIGDIISDRVDYKPWLYFQPARGPIMWAYLPTVVGGSGANRR